MMRLGVIGCGQIAEAGHVPALLASPKVETVAVADISERRMHLVAAALAPRRRPALHTDHRRMLADEQLDAVLIATPPSFHRAQALDVAASGCHVICEKPIATSLRDADAILTACREAGVRCQMVHNYATYEEHVRVREKIEGGVIGRPHTAILQGLGSYPWDGVADFSPGWRYRLELSGGGCLMDAGVHGIYLAELFFGGRPVAVSADLEFGSSVTGGEVRCFARYRFEDGHALLHVGEGHGGCTVEVLGEEGRIEVAYATGARFFDRCPEELRLYRDGVLVDAEPVRPRNGHITAAFYADLAERLQRPPEYEHSGQHGRDLLATVAATYLSATAGRTANPLADVPQEVYERGVAALWS
jgi:predicted dehydrogenase